MGLIRLIGQIGLTGFIRPAGDLPFFLFHSLAGESFGVATLFNKLRFEGFNLPVEKKVSLMNETDGGVGRGFGLGQIGSIRLIG